MSEGQVRTVKFINGDEVAIEERDRVLAKIKTLCITRAEALADLLDASDRCDQWGLMGLAIFYADKALDYADDANMKARCHLRLGALKEKGDDYAGAAALYAEAFSLESGKDDVWYFLNNNLGYCLNQIGRHGGAEFYCRAAIKIDPKRHNAYKNLGLALQGQGRYVEAARMLICAAELCLVDPRALNHLRELVTAHREVVREDPSVLARVEELHRLYDGGRPATVH